MWNPSALFMKYRATYTKACYDLVLHMSFTAASLYSIWFL